MTTDLVEKCARTAKPYLPRSEANARLAVLAVIDALADGVSDEMMHAFRRIEHEHCCLGAALDDVATRPVNDQERRALSAAIRAAKSRETA